MRNLNRARQPVTTGMEAMDRELAALRAWGSEAQRIRADRALNAEKADPLYDARAAFRALKQQLNEGQQ